MAKRPSLGVELNPVRLEVLISRILGALLLFFGSLGFDDALKDDKNLGDGVTLPLDYVSALKASTALLWGVEQPGDSLTELIRHPTEVLGISFQPSCHFTSFEARLCLTCRAAELYIT